MCVHRGRDGVCVDGWMDGETESVDEIGRMLEIG